MSVEYLNNIKTNTALSLEDTISKNLDKLLKDLDLGIPLIDIIEIIKNPKIYPSFIAYLENEDINDNNQLMEFIETKYKEKISLCKKEYDSAQSCPYIVKNEKDLANISIFLKGPAGDFYKMNGQINLKNNIRNYLRRNNHCLVLYGETGSGRRRVLFESLKSFLKPNRKVKEFEKTQIINLINEKDWEDQLNIYIDFMKKYHFKKQLIFLFKDELFGENVRYALDKIRTLQNYNVSIVFVERNKNIEDCNEIMKELNFTKQNYKILNVHTEDLQISEKKDKGLYSSYRKIKDRIRRDPLPVYLDIGYSEYKSYDDLLIHYMQCLFEQEKSNIVKMIDFFIEYINENSTIEADFLTKIFDIVEKEENEEVLNKIYDILDSNKNKFTKDRFLIELKVLIKYKVLISNQAYSYMRENLIAPTTEFLQYIYLNLMIKLTPLASEKQINEYIDFALTFNIENKEIMRRMLTFFQISNTSNTLIQNQEESKTKEIEDYLLEQNSRLEDKLDEKYLWITYVENE